MSKFLVIMKREYAQVVKKKSFLIMTLLTPVIMAALMILPSFLMRKGMTSEVETFAIVDRDGHSLGEQLAAEMEIYTLDDEISPAYLLRGLDDFEEQDSLDFVAVFQGIVRSMLPKEVVQVPDSINIKIYVPSEKCCDLPFAVQAHRFHSCYPCLSARPENHL